MVSRRSLTTLLEGITGAVAAGTKVTWCSGKGAADLDWHLTGVDVVIACLGFTPEMEGEEMGDVGVQERRRWRPLGHRPARPAAGIAQADSKRPANRWCWCSPAAARSN